MFSIGLKPGLHTALVSPKQEPYPFPFANHANSTDIRSGPSRWNILNQKNYLFPFLSKIRILFAKFDLFNLWWILSPSLANLWGHSAFGLQFRIWQILRLPIGNLIASLTFASVTCFVVAILTIGLMYRTLILEALSSSLHHTGHSS